LIPSRSEAQEGTDITSFSKPRRIIDQRDKAQRYDRADTGDSRQAARHWIVFGFLLHRAI
jgi:hypothetical protein